jgi:DNA primase
MKIDVIKILETLKVDYKSAGENNVWIKCINPYHDDSSPSMHLHTSKGIMHCFSCGYKGFITELIKQHLNTTDEIETLYFLHQFATGIGSSFDRTQYKKEIESKIEEKKGIDFPKHRSAVNNPYLIKRGFSNKEIEDWNMGVINDSEYFKNNGWIYVPINQDGELRNYFMRNPFGSDKLYGPYPKRDLLVGIDRGTEDKIYVLEGIFKMIAFRRTRAFAVSSLGNQLSKEQLKLLKQFKTVVIVPDNDTAGFVLVRTAKSLLYNVDLRVCTLPLNKKDADECTLDELLYAQLNEVPIKEYLSKKLIKIA